MRTSLATTGMPQIPGVIVHDFKLLGYSAHDTQQLLQLNELGSPLNHPAVFGHVMIN